MCTVSLTMSAILHSIIFSHGVNLTSLHCICSNLCPLFKKILIYALLMTILLVMIYALFQPIILNPPTFLLVECMSVRIGWWLAGYPSEMITSPTKSSYNTKHDCQSDLHFFTKKRHTCGTNGLLLSNSP